MKNDQDDLEKVATAMADGEAIDWDGKQRTGGPLASKLRRLRTIEEITSAQRTPELESDDSDRKMQDTTTVHEEGPDTPPVPLTFSTWGSLQISGILDIGGYGEVYRAFDPALQKEVALKLVRADHAGDDRSKRKFLEEARRLARVRHPNVLDVHGVGTHRGRAGIWTDLIEGQTLEQFLQAQGRLGWEEAAVIGGTLCRALAAVHAQGLVHHDVKTGNIMREKGGRIVLMDFSTAADRLDRGPRAARRARNGTPRFMAPERFKGLNSGRASDVYSLGVVLYRLVTNRYPVDAKDSSQLAARHERGEWMRLRDARPDLPRAFVQVVERALDPNPSRRFATAGEMEQALAMVLGRAVDQPGGDGLRDARSVVGEILASRWLGPALVTAAVLAVGAYIVTLPGSFEVDAALYRLGDGTDERLNPGSVVAPGDKVFLEIEPSEASYVYVLNADRLGNAYVLFPLPGLDLQNPLPGGARHRLPGTIGGKGHSWIATSVGGQELFLVIASERRLDDFEEEIGRYQQARVGAPISVEPQALRTLRGFGGIDMDRRSDSADGERPFDGLVSAMTQRAAAEGGLWAWEIELRNPQ